MRNECTMLIDALACAMTNKPFTVPKDMDWQFFTKLCQAHAVLPLVCDGFVKASLMDDVPQEVRRLLQDSCRTAVFRDVQHDYLRKELSKKLEMAKVRHIYLKGACLKYDYPVPSLRTMCDMDILVYAADFAKIDEVVKSLGGNNVPGDGNHRNYHFPNGVVVEFHPNLLHHATPIGTHINPGWQYAREIPDRYEMELTEEGFYLNTTCHLANHFVAGGVGVRFVLDVWVNRYLHKPEMDRAFVKKELTRFGLLEFTQNIEMLADAWFGQGEMTSLLEELGDYILSSGSHGTTERAMLNAVSLARGGNRFFALCKKAFYPRAELEDRFPWCKNKLWLLPAAWCCRAYKAVANHRDLIVKWGKDTSNIHKKEAALQREKLRRFGLINDTEPHGG